MNAHRIVGGVIHALSGAIGLLAFIYPFFLQTQRGSAINFAHSQDALLVTVALVGLSLMAMLVELQGQAVSAKTVALLGVMVAIASVLRFIEVAVPIPGGFSPIFAPIILAGYVFGGRFGFLMGIFTLLLSGLITGGIGPWLPYQMFTAGWVGLTAGWLSNIIPQGKNLKFEAVTLSAFGFVWGLLYGLIINLYFWPLASGPVEQTWVSGISFKEILTRYAAFYAVTSLGWDLARAVGNAALILFLGAPTIRALARFQRRFYFEVSPAHD